LGTATYSQRIDKSAFYDELLEGFICREYVDRFGPMEWDFKEKAIDRYRNDPIFHNRVQQVTGQIMMLEGKHKRYRLRAQRVHRSCALLDIFCCFYLNSVREF